MSPRVFTATDGLNSRELSISAADHLSAAHILFDSGPSYFDSAGYLAHIGIELLLKSWLLEQAGAFEGIHVLESLHDRLAESGAAISLDENHLQTLRMLDEFEGLRYPDLLNPIEIGDQDWERIYKLFAVLASQAPDVVVPWGEAIDPKDPMVKKGGRILMKKRRDA